jgi:hypothetical protein
MEGCDDSKQLVGCIDAAELISCDSHKEQDDGVSLAVESC